jgi:hypothetical protein
LPAQNRRKKAVKKAQKSKSYQKIDWQKRKAPKKNSKLRAQYKKSSVYKKRSKAAKKGSVRKKLVRHAVESKLREEIARLKRNITKQDRRNRKLKKEIAKEKKALRAEKAVLGLKITGTKQLIDNLKKVKGLRKRVLEEYIAQNRKAIESFALLEEVPLREIYDSIFGY